MPGIMSHDHSFREDLVSIRMIKVEMSIYGKAEEKTYLIPIMDI
jgi:hypothetical protein